MVPLGLGLGDGTVRQVVPVGLGGSGTRTRWWDSEKRGTCVTRLWDNETSCTSCARD